MTNFSGRLRWHSTSPQKLTNTACVSLPIAIRRGKRCVYYFPLDLQTLDGLLPQRVDENMIRGANRRLTPSHAKTSKNTCEKKMSGCWAECC